MNFDDIEMTESYGLRDSSYSFKNSEQQTQEPYQKQAWYRCYQCGGDSAKSAKCRTCNGLKEVKSSNAMVGLLMRVMCCKLSKEVPSLKTNPPKLQFSSQNRIGSKSSKVKFDNKIKIRSRATTETQNAPNRPKIEHYSQGNSINDSNSVDSSLDSMDNSSQTSRSNIRSKEKLQRNKSARQLYSNQPHFRQQISEIKEESYATEDYSVCCDVCQKDWDPCGGQFMECRTCKHYYICQVCYQEKVEQLRKKSTPDSKPKLQLPEMKKQKSTFLATITTSKQLPFLQKLQTKNKSCQFIPSQPATNPGEIVNYDNYFQIHEHPLSRYHNSNEERDEQPDENYRYVEKRVDDWVREEEPGDEQEIFATYGQVKAKQSKEKEKEKGESGKGSGYKNLFKVYDSNGQECPQSPKRSSQYLNIQVIRQQRQSPSPSQKSSQAMLREGQCQFEHNISMTISNNYDSSPENAKQGSMAGAGVFSNNNSPVNVKLAFSGNIDDIRDSGNGNEYKTHNEGLGQDGNIRVSDKNKLIKQVKMNRDTSQWSWYSGQQPDTPKNPQNKALTAAQQSNIEIMQDQDQSQSRIIESPENVKEQSKSVKSSKQSYIDKEMEASDAEKVRKEKEKSYTQKKVNNYTEVRFKADERKNKSDRRQEEDDKSGDNFGKDSIQIKFNVGRNLFFPESPDRTLEPHGQREDSLRNADKYPLVINYVSSTKPPEDPDHLTPLEAEQIRQAIRRTQSFQIEGTKCCKNCHKQIMNRSMYMKCETCERNNQQAYQLCDGCFGMREVIDRHNGGKKHTFKAYLYRKSEPIGLMNSMDDESGEESGVTNKLSVPLGESVSSFYVEPVKYVVSPPKQPLTSEKEPQSPSCLNQILPSFEAQQDEKFTRQRQQKQNELYLKKRQKQCQQNEHLTRIYKDLLLSSMAYSNRLSETLSKSSFQANRYSENVGVDGNWVTGTSELHTSVTCIPLENDPSNKQKDSAVSPFTVFPSHQKQSVLPPQSVINIHTGNTIRSNSKQDTLKASSNNTSIILPLTTNRNNLAPIDRESPSKLSAKSGSPDKSNISSRIKVDCGDSESEFQMHDIARADEEGQQFTKPVPQQLQNLTKSNRLVQKDSSNILGQSYAESEPIDTEEAGTIDEEFMAGNNYRIVTHKISKNQNQREHFLTWDPTRAKSTTKQKQKKDQCLSKSSDKSRKKNQQELDRRDGMMAFLGQIDKSQKLSKSDQSSEKSRQVKQGVHYDYEQDAPRKLSEQRSQGQSSSELQQQEYFVFSDYECDICHQSPVNARYNCKKCKNYDLCVECFKTSSQQHEHRRHHFEKITKKKELALMEEEKKNQQKQRNNILKCIIQKFVPQHSESLNTSLGRSSVPDNKQSLSTSTNGKPLDIWRLTHSLHPGMTGAPKVKGSSMGRSTDL